jgi:hypothetical protein
VTGSVRKEVYSTMASMAESLQLLNKTVESLNEKFAALQLLNLTTVATEQSHQLMSTPEGGREKESLRCYVINHTYFPLHPGSRLLGGILSLPTNLEGIYHVTF